MRRTGHVALLFTIALFVSCSSERVELENTVRAYNELNARAVATGNADILGLFASEREMRRVSAFITKLRAEGRLLVGKSPDMEFVSARVEGAGRAQVETREAWQYYFVDSRTGAALTRPREMHFRNTYTLIRMNGHWAVDRVSSRRAMK